jgi:hypothetical protein
MAEVAGLMIGATSLTALFTSCMDAFEHIQLGPQLGKDYRLQALKLDVLKLRGVYHE